jgi:hypothetical protein
MYSDEGDRKSVAQEEPMDNIKFHIHKFNNRPKPDDTKAILIITCFSEFGCESLGLMYCIPRVLQMYPGAYVIAVGWYGRSYLYKHLVDEFWEVKEEHQWLREYSRAFHHKSKNIDRIHKSLADYGQVMEGSFMGRFAVGNLCRNCDHFWHKEEHVPLCPECGSHLLDRSLFGDINYWKRLAVRIPRPNRTKQREVAKYLKEPKWKMPTRPIQTEWSANVRKYLGHVGIFARGRQCYGRNLTPEYYTSLIGMLREKGYEPIWLGEKQSTLECPVDDVVDFSRMPESRDLELTLSIISQLEFTIQYWTASTRFAAMVDVPYLLFESPDQISGVGQEGYRMALTSDWDKKKLVLSHYLTVLENPVEALALTKRAIEEMEANNWEHIYGMVEDPEIVKSMVANKNPWSIR